MSEILLSIKNIKKRYDSIEALKGVSFDLYKGEIVSLLGVNGAGKTTLSSIIATLCPASEGDIQYNGNSIYKNLISFRQILGFCPQKPNLNPHLTVDEILTLAGKLFGMSDIEIEQKKNELLKQFELEKYKNSFHTILSGGYRHRLLIARELMHSPKLMIFDEPTVGLDPHIRQQLWQIIKSLKQYGVTVLLTTHYLDEAEYLSDRVVILDKGLVKVIDTPAELMRKHEKGKLEDVFLKLMSEEAI